MDDRVNSIHLLEKVLTFQEIDDDDDALELVPRISKICLLKTKLNINK